MPMMTFLSFMLRQVRKRLAKSSTVHAGPLLVMSLADGEFNCSTTEFITQGRLDNIIAREHDFMYSKEEMISVIPQLSFSSPGSVLSWTFTGRRVLGSDDSAALESGNFAVPHIQIWRPMVIRTKRQFPDGRMLRYTMVNTTADLPGLEIEEDDNVVTYHMPSEVEVREGDAVGVEQPDGSELLLVFQPGSCNNYIIESGTSELTVETISTVMRQPLLRPEFEPSG